VPVLMKTTHLFGVLQVMLSLPVTGVATDMMVGPSSLVSGGAEPPSKKVRPWSFLSMSSRYVHGVVHQFVLLSLLSFSYRI
jgi:hypothetical protein